MIDPQHLSGEEKEELAELEALGRAYERLYPRLLRFCRRRCSTGAEDIVQETFARAITYRLSFDPAYPPWPWLKGIASNLLVENARNARWREGGLSRIGSPELADPTSAVDDMDRLDRALRTLSARQREAVLLRYIQDLSAREAALRMGVSVTAFTQLLFRARERLREEYRRVFEAALGVASVSLSQLRSLRRWLGIDRRTRGLSVESSSRLMPVLNLTAASLAVALFLQTGGVVKQAEAVTRPAPIHAPGTAASTSPEAGRWRSPRPDLSSIPGPVPSAAERADHSDSSRGQDELSVEGTLAESPVNDTDVRGKAGVHLDTGSHRLSIVTEGSGRVTLSPGPTIDGPDVSASVPDLLTG